MKAIEIVKSWVDAFNKQDTDAICNLYDVNAVNHQVVTEPLVGINAIREMFETEFSRAKMFCKVENIFESGDWAILEWSDPIGLRGCGFFHVKNDKIIFQRGYFDQLTFFRLQKIPVPENYLDKRE